MRLALLALSFPLVFLAGCSSGGPKPIAHSSSAPAGIAALDVSVELRVRSTAQLRTFQAALERSMIRRYKRSGRVPFGRIRFVIDTVKRDPVARGDLLLSGRLIVSTRSGTETRTLERRIHNGASTPAEQWTQRLVPSLLNAMDYQLRLMQR